MRKVSDIGSKATDESLLSAISRGDTRAFTILYNRYWRKLFVLASNKLRDSAVAEEITQDLFSSIWSRRETLSVHGKFETYLAVALKYKIIDVMAHEQHRRRYLEHEQVARADWDDSTRQWLEYDELRERLEKLVETLPDKCRIVYELRQDGHSQKAIAEKMQISPNTVENHLAKAYKIIRERFTLFGTGIRHTFFFRFISSRVA